jgi:putative OPT family oligopeptide transporter
MPEFPASQPSPAEFTLRAVILGLAIGTVMTAANTYLGLYAGMTVSASIPAAIVSMGILRGLLRRGTILENNIVQTMASAGESVAAGIIFTVPALMIAGVWREFPYWQVTLIGLLGGVLGVLFMIPLRRTLIVEDQELIYPEGVACARVLEAG